MSDLPTSSTKIVIADGKYTIHHENGTNLRCLRYGQHWRDLVGDGMVLAMAQEIESLRDELKELKYRLASLDK